MSVRRISDEVVALEGVCPLEDAETLLEYLMEQPALRIEWGGCESAHAAVIQILMVSKAVLENAPRGRFLRDHVAPALSRLSD